VNMKSTDLPGVGKKVSFVTSQEDLIVVVTHHTGKREMYFFEDEEGDEVLHSISLTDDESKQLGAQMIGVTYQPIDSDTVRTYNKKLLMDWVKIKKGSHLIGKTLEESNIRAKTGASVMAITRGDDDDIIINPRAEEVIQLHDVVMVAGKVEQIKSFEVFCESKGS
jgi:TrkA domain protein